MKKFTIILIVAALSQYTLKAQIGAIFSDDFPEFSTARIGITGEYDLNSNALPNSFISKFYTGGYIDESLKNNVLEGLRNKNRIGGNYGMGIYAAYRPDSISHKKRYLSFFVSVRDRFHADAQFSRDVYKLALYGNQQFAGKTAYMNDFSLNVLHYQQFQVGMFSSNLDSAARWGIGLSFLKGQDYLSVQAKKAELFTSEDGQYIDFATELEVEKSDTARTGLGAFNGYGVGVDIYFEAPFETRLGSSKIKLSVSDIGIIRYNKQTLTLKADSTYHYNGINVNSLFNINADGSGSTESIIDSILPFAKKGYSASLPAVFDLTYETKLTERFHIMEGMRYVFNANYGLLAYLRGNFYITPRFMMSATFGYGGYGGYGRFNYGLGLFTNFKNGVVVYAGSNNLEGYFAPKTHAGQGVYLSLIKNFK